MNIINELFGFLSTMGIEESVKYDNTPKEIGDKVVLVDDAHLNYFIDVDSDEQLSKGLGVLSEAVKSLFTQEPMTVVSINIEKIYKCGHCSVNHKHDMIVYVPQLKKRYFCSQTDMKHSK